MLKWFLYLQVPQGWSRITTPASTPGTSKAVGLVDTETRVPVINVKDGTRLAGDDAPKRKDLDQWLKEHPGFVADVGDFIPVINRTCFLGCPCGKCPKSSFLGCWSYIGQNT